MNSYCKDFKFDKVFDGVVIDEDISKLEKKYNIELPDDYKEFICQFNGGVPRNKFFTTVDGKVSSLVDFFFPFVGYIDINVESEYLGITLSKIIPDKYLVIAQTPAQNRILLSLSKDDYGSVLYWAWDEEPDPESCSKKYMRVISESFKSFLVGLGSTR